MLVVVAIKTEHSLESTVEENRNNKVCKALVE